MSKPKSQLWQPTANLAALQARAHLYANIRAFFATENILEVETPALSVAGIPDPHIPNVAATTVGGYRHLNTYLHTSPEFFMKRLLAANMGDIYQICKVWRDGELGPRHNPEFSLLEWYRQDWSAKQLRAELTALLAKLLPQLNAPLTLTYSELFKQYAGLDIWHCQRHDILHCLAHVDLSAALLADTSDSALLDLVLMQVVEPQLKSIDQLYVIDYPAEQASLAKLNVNAVPGQPTAARFELYIRGLEIANGFEELVDAQEQQQRFNAENTKRAELGLPVIPLDHLFIQALEHGMPACSGVAVGLDRVLMIALGVENIADILSFSAERA